MNLNHRTSRYGAGVLFAASLAGTLLIAAMVRADRSAEFELWLAAALVVSIILHARMGLALSSAQLEIDMLRNLASRARRGGRANPPAPALKLDPSDASDLNELDQRALARVSEAIEHDRLDLYLQPVVSLPQRKVRYYEAFSRLRTREGAVLKPSDYLNAAERANRIGVIDNMILLRCIQSLSRIAQADSSVAIFCNISPATLYDTAFFNHFTDYLELNEDLASRLIFEFTYPASQIMHPRFEENLASIAGRGFAFSIDHVPSLDLDWAALRARNFRFAKASAALLKSTTQFSDARVSELRARIAGAGVSLVAEKVEKESDLPDVYSLGIDYGQGALFGAPATAAFYLEPKSVADFAKAS